MGRATSDEHDEAVEQLHREVSQVHDEAAARIAALRENAPLRLFRVRYGDGYYGRTYTVVARDSDEAREFSDKAAAADREGQNKGWKFEHVGEVGLVTPGILPV